MDAGRPDRGRLLAVDVLRGLALASMVTTHAIANGGSSVLFRIAHAPRWVDGASIFVVLSGFVVGLVHRRIVNRHGLAASARKLARRATFIYLVHVALTLAIVGAASARHVASFGEVPMWSDAGGVRRGIVEIARLRLQTSFNDVLPMYVCFLAAAIVFVQLLWRGRAWLVVASSVGVYTWSQAVGGFAFTAGGFDVLAWQLLFTAGLVTGWTWEHERQRVSTKVRRVIVVASAEISAALLIAARMPVHANRAFGSALSKFGGGWLVFVGAGAVTVTGFAAIDHMRTHRAAQRPLRVIGMLGAKGLPGYATMVLAILALDLVPAVPRNDAVIVGLIAACGVSEYLALRWAARRRRVPPAATVPVIPPWPPPRAGDVVAAA